MKRSHAAPAGAGIAPFKVIAIISSFNEGDVIARVIEHLVSNQVEVYLLDNHSTDDTVAQASAWLGRGLLHIEDFPAQPPSDGRFQWAEILERKERLANELSADWFIHHDADEIREGPWPGLNLRESIQWVQHAGYNCIDFRVFNFPPTKEGFKQGDDLKAYFEYFEVGADYDLVQRKCWQAGPAISLVTHGGHDVEFEGRRVFPIPFVLRHYPIRGQVHGTRKIFQERHGRFVEAERRRGWHRQYDKIFAGASFLADADSLERFDLDRVRRDIVTAAVIDLERLVLHRQQYASNLEQDIEQLRNNIADMSQDRALLRKEMSSVQAELKRVVRHGAAVEADRVELRRHLEAASQELARVGEHVEMVEQDRTTLRHNLHQLIADSERAGEHVRNIEVDRERLREEITRLQDIVAALQGRCDDLVSTAAVIEEELANRSAEAEALKAELARGEQDRAELLAQNELLHNTRSWRWTAPLRQLDAILRRKRQS